MINVFTGKKLTVFLHLFAWAILLGLPLYFFKRWDVGKDFIWLYYIGNFINGIIFYSNYLVLVPRYFFGSKKHRYYLSAFFLLAFLYVVSERSNELIFKYVPGHEKHEEKEIVQGEKDKPGPPPFRQIHFLNYIFTSFILIFFSIGLRVMERHSLTEKLQKELEKEKLNSELAFLKSQISPHFFFNTLNNIYALIGINVEDSQKAVLKLSKLMRYLLYESEHGNTLMSNEIDFMNNYIDLMKLRMNDKINLSVSFPEKFEDFNIPPLLFIPFIENAFKHGISYREKSFIDISMTVKKDSLTFLCNNSLFNSRETEDLEHSGIGLENVGKRLNLLFPGKHELKTNKSDSAFEVILNINFAS